MTTIAIDAYGNMACDGRKTDQNGYIVSDATQKIFYDKELNVYYAFAGVFADCNTLVDIVINGAEINVQELRANLVVVNQDGPYLYTLYDGQVKAEPIDPPYAIGSGEQFAISAMDFGLTAKEAIKYAVKRDASSGGKIKVVKWRKD